jgi:hypothetical protein
VPLAQLKDFCKNLRLPMLSWARGDPSPTSPKEVALNASNADRIRALEHLILNETDKARIKLLADELGRLLTIEPKPPRGSYEKPRSS